jgi:hypothetical protein
MIREELKHLVTGPRELRKFGFTVGGVFLLLSLWFLYRHKPFWPWLAAPGVVLVLCGAVHAKAIKYIFIGWMAMAFGLGLIVSTVLLTLFFYLIVTPIGLSARLLGKDFLSQKLQPSARSYWISRLPEQAKNATDYERQY